MTATTKGASLIGRWGLLADPRGAHAMWTIGGRTYLATVTDVQRRAIDGAYILSTRFFCGDTGPDVALGFVKLLNRDAESETK